MDLKIGNFFDDYHRNFFEKLVLRNQQEIIKQSSFGLKELYFTIESKLEDGDIYDLSEGMPELEQDMVNLVTDYANQPANRGKGYQARSASVFLDFLASQLPKCYK